MKRYTDEKTETNYSTNNQKQSDMRKILMMFALLTGFMAAYAQQSGGDYFEGLSRKIGFSRMIPPHGLEITYDKTVHVIFPSPIKYVDLGSTNLIAGKADGAENVIRVKAARKHFRNETNMSVITEDGNFYTFNVKYADEPLLLNVEMCDFIHDGETVNRTTRWKFICRSWAVSHRVWYV